jgi:hypothetical protein
MNAYPCLVSLRIRPLIIVILKCSFVKTTLIMRRCEEAEQTTYRRRLIEPALCCFLRFRRFATLCALFARQFAAGFGRLLDLIQIIHTDTELGRFRLGAFAIHRPSEKRLWSLWS